MPARRNSVVVRPQALLASGVSGLDSVLGGGFSANRLYLVEGLPGSGKTTLALQFLLEGARNGEPVLYMTLSETEEEIQAVAASHGWSLDGLHIHEVIPDEDSLHSDQQYTMFYPSEVELSETVRKILSKAEDLRPTRTVLDSVSEVRLLAGSALRYRRQLLALKNFFTTNKCAMLLLDDRTAGEHDELGHSIAHGILKLEQVQPEYGAEKRRLSIVKYRGTAYRGGYHDFVIRRGGLQVFPRLVAAESRERPTRDKMISGVAELDTLLGGGIERGTSTLIAGAPGSGKSSLAAQFASAAADRGQRVAMFVFDESLDTLLIRSAGLGIDLQAHLKADRITIQQIDPAELSPGEFAHFVRQAADQDNAALIVIDSLNGYLNAMPDERFLTIQLHELLTYLGQAGAATVLIGGYEGVIGTSMTSPGDSSYLADTVVLLRYFEAGGEIRHSRVPARAWQDPRGQAPARVPRCAHRGSDVRGRCIPAV